MSRSALMGTESPSAARSGRESAAGCYLVDVEVAIAAVRNHRLARLKMELDAIEMD